MYYNKNDFALLRMAKIDIQTGYIVSGPTVKSTSPIIFEIENELSIGEKIEFIDMEHQDVATYLLNLIYRWERESKYLPRGKNKKPTVSSTREWFRKYDSRQLVSTADNSLGAYQLFRTIYDGLSRRCPHSAFGYNLTHTNKHIAEQWFHDLLIHLQREEMKAASQHNKLAIV